LNNEFLPAPLLVVTGIEMKSCHIFLVSFFFINISFGSKIQEQRARQGLIRPEESESDLGFDLGG
jgi:hypothetical protein